MYTAHYPLMLLQLIQLVRLQQLIIPNNAVTSKPYHYYLHTVVFTVHLLFVTGFLDDPYYEPLVHYCV